MTAGGAATPASIDAVYQDQILDHYRHPHGKGALPHPDATATVRNPFCGEEVTVSVMVDRSGAETRVRDIQFVGDGCSLSQASASMMTDLVRGRTVAEIAALADRFTALLRGDPDAARDDRLGPLRAFAAMSRVPARIPCALLAWEGLGKEIGG